MDCWKPASAIVGLYLGVLVAAAALLPSPSASTHGTRLALCLLAIETVALAAAAPFLAARAFHAARRAARVACVLAPLGGMAIVSLVITAAASQGILPLTTLAWSQLFLLAFALLLAAAVSLLAALGLRPTTAQLAATLLGLAMLGNVFFANSLVEAATAERAKMLVISASLWTNPWLVVGGSILEADPLRSEDLYSWSVIIYYAFTYPASSIASVALRSLSLATAYAVPAAGLQLAAGLCHRACRAPAASPSEPR